MSQNFCDNTMRVCHKCLDCHLRGPLHLPQELRERAKLSLCAPCVEMLRFLQERTASCVDDEVPAEGQRMPENLAEFVRRCTRAFHINCNDFKGEFPKRSKRRRPVGAKRKPRKQCAEAV